MEVAVVMVMRIAEDDRSNSIWKQEKGSFFRCALNPVGEYNVDGGEDVDGGEAMSEYWFRAMMIMRLVEGGGEVVEGGEVQEEELSHPYQTPIHRI